MTDPRIKSAVIERTVSHTYAALAVAVSVAIFAGMCVAEERRLARQAIIDQEIIGAVQ